MLPQTRTTQGKWIRGQMEKIISLIAALAALVAGATQLRLRTSLANHSTYRVGDLGTKPLKPRPSVSGTSITATPILAAAYGKLPLAFEANQGQTDSRVKFVSRGRGYTIVLTKELSGSRR